MWLVFPLLAVGVGLARWPWWTVALCPAASMALGISVVANEPPNYDMHGFGLSLGIAGAVASVVAWLIGRGIAAVRQSRKQP